MGGFVGSKAEAQSWGSNKVQSWVKSLKILSEVARKQTQAAFVAVSKSLQMNGITRKEYFQVVKICFKNKVYSKIFPLHLKISNPISDLEFNIFEKTTRLD